MWQGISNSSLTKSNLALSAVHITLIFYMLCSTLRRVRESLLLWKCSKYYICVRARVPACVYPSAWACACAYVYVALLIKHATRMRHIVTSFVAPHAPPYFSTLPHKRHDFKKKLLNIKCAFWFSLQLLPKTFLILRRLQRDIAISVKTTSHKILVILVGF